LARFRPSDRRSARETLGLLQDRKYILFPFDPKRRLKRFDLAEAAVELLRQDGCEVSLLPVFDAPNEAMPTYYSAADAMILCSDTEGSPTSVKEALACNLPVVATDVGDVRFLLEGIEGAQLCQQTAVSLASGLRRVLSRQDWSAFRGRQAMEKFDQAMTAKKLVEVYRSVAPKARPYSARLGTS
jgi:glycosyltransferase involved in cell wall biosynthesis